MVAHRVDECRAAGGTIAGNIVDGTGAPVADAIVSWRGPMTTHCLTDAAGAFVCGGLRGGSYAARVFPASGASHAFRFLEVPRDVELRDGDARADGVQLVVAPTLLTIEGKVVDGSGAPVPDVAVNAFGYDRRPRDNFQSPPGSITDDIGRFRIAGLSTGEYLVEVQRRGLAARQAVAAGATNVTVVLDQPPCVGARGRVVPVSLTKPRAPVVWDQSIELIGWSVPATARIGEDVEVTIVYRALKPLEHDWTIFAHFSSATEWVNADHDPGIGWCPTKQWKPGETVADHATVRFDEAGQYALTIGFFSGRAPNWKNLPISSAPTEMHDTKQQGVHLTDVVVTK